MNKDTKYGILRNETIDLPDLAQSCIIRGLNELEELNKSIRDLWSGGLAFQNPCLTTREKTYPKILKSPESRMDSMEEKFDGLTEQTEKMAEHATLMKGTESWCQNP